DEAGRVVRAAVEGNAAVIEEPAGSGPDRRIGRRAVRLQGRREAEGRLVLRVPGVQVALPGLTAVEGLEDPEPRIAGEGAGHDVGERQVGRAVIDGAGEQVQRAAR